jgi:hypothetical protein
MIYHSCTCGFHVLQLLLLFLLQDSSDVTVPFCSKTRLRHCSCSLRLPASHSLQAHWTSVASTALFCTEWCSMPQYTNILYYRGFSMYFIQFNACKMYIVSKSSQKCGLIFKWVGMWHICCGMCCLWPLCRCMESGCMLETVSCVLELLEWRCVQAVQNNVSISADSQHYIHVQARQECCVNIVGITNWLWGYCS